MKWLIFAGLVLLSLVFLLRGGAGRSRRGAAGRLRRLHGRAEKGGRAAWVARIGGSVPVRLAASRVARRLSAAFEESGVRIPFRSFLSLWLGSLPLAAAVAYAVTGSALSIPVTACVLLFVPRPLLNALGRRRRRRAGERCERLAGDIALHLTCGMPVPDAVRLCAPDAGGELSGAIDRFAASLALGACPNEAFLSLSRELRDPDLELIAHAVLTSRETGSDVRVVMAAVGEALRERTAIRRELHTQTAQGRLSGQIVAGLPLLFLGLSLLVSRESLSVLLGTAPGLVMLGAAALLDILGFFWIRKILDVSSR